MGPSALHAGPVLGSALTSTVWARPQSEVLYHHPKPTPKKKQQQKQQTNKTNPKTTTTKNKQTNKTKQNSSACHTARPQLCVPDSQRPAMEYKQYSALLHSRADQSLHLPRDGQM